MKSQKLSIRINKPANEVFLFSIKPKNTPKWISFIVEEKTNEWPVKLGTIYQNRTADSDWSEYTMSNFIENKVFVLSKKNSTYNVRYTFTPISEDSTELEYYEWVDDGDLGDPFAQTFLEKMKSILENSD